MVLGEAPTTFGARHFASAHELVRQRCRSTVRGQFSQVRRSRALKWRDRLHIELQPLNVVPESGSVRELGRDKGRR